MNHPKHIVYCIPHLYNAGGMERVLTQKVNWLVAHTPSVITIVTTERVPEGKTISHFDLDKRVQIIELNIDFNADFQAPLIKKFIAHHRKQRIYRQALEQILQQKKADVCVSLCGKEIEWLGRSTVPCRKIAELHFTYYQRAQQIAVFHSGFLWRMLGCIRTMQFATEMKRIDDLVVLTHADATLWRAKGVKNVHVIPNPSAILPTSEGKHHMPQVLGVGRLHPEKGFDHLLQAWSRIAVQNPAWTLRICGEGDDRKRLEEIIEQSGLRPSVRMEGVSADIRRDYMDSAIFVLSSYFEGLPLALMEAMSCGCACIAYDCSPGIRELIEDGRTGILVPAGNIDALARTMPRLIEDETLRLKLGNAAYAYAKEHFGEESIMQQWMKVIEL